MQQHKKEKLIRFLQDESMERAVYETLLDIFLRKNETGDVQVLASERIAITLLQEAWKELYKLKNEKKQEQREIKQVGL